ncbi:MAG TPA: TlpA disulfide reductase family protein, partial [Bryobacterales bacterium]|nr:TlpA disulfide reductase family protein [Bryobacterales bacterium]
MTVAALVLAAAPLDLKPIDQPGYRSVLASQRGKVVLVDFWATWCGPCREEMPAIAALQKKWQGKRFV